LIVLNEVREFPSGIQYLIVTAVLLIVSLFQGVWDDDDGEIKLAP